jgi:hypothetical protein
LSLPILCTGWYQYCLYFTHLFTNLFLKKSPYCSISKYNMLFSLVFLQSFNNIIICFMCSLFLPGPSWSWSYGSLIYNFLCNQCLSPLKLWVRSPFMARCTPYNIMWKRLSVTCDRSVVFFGYSSFLHQ